MKYLSLPILLFFVLYLPQVRSEICAGMAEGETIRLDQDGKSLNNFRVQDQDGVGVCYATAASILLQAKLPKNPEVSYLHLASISKSEELNEKRKIPGSLDNLYATKVNDPSKAVNGSGLTNKWDLAIDGGHTCDVIKKVIDLEEKNKKPSLCSRRGVNLERILSSEDNDHNQFKTILSTSVYMTSFQKTFVDLDEKPTYWTKKKVQEKRKNYEDFRDNIRAVINKKRNDLEKNHCQKINTDNLDKLLMPLVQKAIGYTDCFDEKKEKYKEYWCDDIRDMATNVKFGDDGTVLSDGVSSDWMNRLKKKISNMSEDFDSEKIRRIIIDTFLAKPEKKQKESSAEFLTKLMDNKIIKNNLDLLADEYNETKNSGFSNKCVTRHLFDYVAENEFENDWNNSIILCTHGELFRGAKKLIIDYKLSGLNDIDNALSFITSDANLNYNDAMLALYASDCDDSQKLSLPKNLKCETSNVKIDNQLTTNQLIIRRLKDNQPLVANMCSAILKKPKSQFVDKECGHHAQGLTGIKCEGGKLKYLIQNSWGAKHKAINSNIENIEGKGAYWFDEASFFDSVYSLEFLD